MNYLIEQIRDSSSLQHHGIKGMHWGVRRNLRRAGSRVKSKFKRKEKEDLSGLSDQELRQRLNRLQMEEQYARMTAPKQSYARRLAVGTATGLVGAMAMNGAKHYTRQAMINAGHEDLADAFLPKKKKGGNK